MARSRQFPFRQIPRSQRRETDWGTGPDAQGVSVTVPGTNVGWTNGVTPTVPGLTLVRTRGSFELLMTAAAAITDRAQVAIGIGIVTDQAFAIGASALPGAFQEAGWDGWLFHQFINLSPSQTDAGGVLLGRGPSVYRGLIDSKAMRKFNPENTMFGSIEMGIEAGTVTVQLRADTRMLFKLS